MPTPSRTEIRQAVTAHEMSTSSYWRGVMKRARKERGVTQEGLAELVGCEQPTISGVESGSITASRYVAAISAALDIPLPHILIEDEYDERWVDAGRVLRRRNLRVFLNYLDIFEAEAGDEDELDS